MLAFHNDPLIKEKYLNRVKAHAIADEIVKGKYWSDGKGCAVGCTIHGSNHNAYETELGIPEWLAELEDTLFEGMPNEKAKLWPEKFLEAIPVGADLEKVKAEAWAEAAVVAEAEAAWAEPAVARVYEKYADKLLELLRECK